MPPSLHPHYRNFNTTTRQSATSVSVATFCLACLRFRHFRLSSRTCFSRSLKEPASSSCHLYAVHPTDSKQVILSHLSQRQNSKLWFWCNLLFANGTSSMVHSRSSPWCSPRLIHISLPIVVHDQSVSLPAAQSGFQTAPVRRMRWACHHLFQSSKVLPSSGQLGKSSSRDTRFSQRYALFSLCLHTI